MSSITIRHYKSGDEQGIRKLFQEVFRREMSIEEWTWKYRGTGAPRVYCTVGVTEDNAVIAHYGGIPLPMVYDGRTIMVLSVCDVMIHPKYRGIKTLRRITSFHRDEARKAGFAMCPGFPTENTLMLPTEKLGLIERTMDVLGAEKEITSQRGASLLAYRHYPMEFDDPSLDRLWEETRDGLGLALVRNRQYLIWRYKNHPLYRYECWGIRKPWSRLPSGMAVLRNDEASQKVLIMDMLFTAGSMKPLIQKVENMCHASGRKSLALWLPARWHPLLRELGFALHRHGSVGRDTENPVIGREEMVSKYFFTMGDTDFL